MNTIEVTWKNVILEHDKPYIYYIDLGNRTQFKLITFLNFIKRFLFVGIEGYSCYLFPIDKEIHWEYFRQKILTCEADSRNLSDWVNCQIGHFKEQQGNYYDYIKNNCEDTDNGLITLRPRVLMTLREKNV